MSILLFLIILAVLIVSHEFGHFIVAKGAGIRVDEFAVGFAPKLWSWVRGETKYSIGLLPFGGYVKIFGEDANEEGMQGPDRERSFTGKPRYIQALVVAAGVVFNLLLAWVLFSWGFLAGLPVSVESAPSGGTVTEIALTVTMVLPESPAAKAGLKDGDRITDIGILAGTNVKKPASLEPEAVQAFIASHPGERIAVMYERGRGNNEKTESVVVTPQAGLVEGERSVLGIGLDQVGLVRLPFHLAVLEGARLTGSLTVRTITGFYDLIAKSMRKEEGGGLAALTGPIGIVGLVGDASQFGFAYLLSFIAIISVNLAVLNMVPFPALDGGRLLFIGIEALLRRPIPAKVANALNMAGFALLITLMVLVTYRDIIRLIG
ncbi:site-2 protease family protein [Candidatus Parcubacteria bacterium]|nr:site-2 protease family protein [Candidatus Parcubacteria bacterium]